MTPPTVFVVDDNPGVRRSLKALIEAEGMAVRTFATASEFLAAYDPEESGCLVLDIRLRGGRNGLDIQDELRRRHATLPIIVVTGYGDVPTSVRAFKGGAVDYLEKPVPPKRLTERIRACIELDRRTREAAARRSTVADRIARLTPRERMVMDLLAWGRARRASPSRCTSACGRWRAIAGRC
jgi:two-component system response regulator TtrR